MNDRIFENLSNEPKPELSPFFAARAVRAARERGRGWMRAYWVLAAALSTAILVFTGWTMLLGIPASLWIARSNWRRWLA
jgi:hypothetical protein